MGFPRQEYWSRLPFPSPGDCPNPEIKPMAPAKSPAWKADFLLLSYLGSPYKQHSCCSCSAVVQQFFTPCIAAHQSSLSFTISLSLLKLISIGSMMPSNHLILCCPRLLPSIFPSIRVFCKQSALLTRWLKYWSFSFSFSLSNEYSGLISFRIDWFDLLAVQGTLKHLLQHHNSKVSTLWHSAFLMVQLTSIHDYWKNHSFDYMDLCWQ